MSLRTRLILALLALLALGLFGSGYATYRLVESDAMKRVDTRLRSLYAELKTNGDLTARSVQSETSPVRSVVSLRLAAANQQPFERQATEAPLPEAALESLPPGSTYYETVSRRGYRSRAATFVDGFGQITIAVPLGESDALIARLFRVEVLVGVTAMALLGGLAFLIVRRGLRPMARIATTADAISSGDLTQRIPNRSPHTEIGRLSTALNHMLEQIEASFREREASEARVRRFAADASHELRTPLTSIRGYSELYRRGAVSSPGDLATTMSRIETEAQRMGVLVEDLLLLARLDEHLPLAQEPVNLAALAEHAADAARVADEMHPVVINVDPTLWVTGDAARIGQIAASLLANVQAHTPAGTTATVQVASKADRVVLSVADDGPGIAVEHHPHLFERFYRADPSRARATGGSGLGLAIVHSIATAHSASVGVDQVDPHGTRVWVSFPAAVSRPEPVPSR